MTRPLTPWAERNLEAARTALALDDLDSAEWHISEANRIHYLPDRPIDRDDPQNRYFTDDKAAGGANGPPIDDEATRWARYFIALDQLEALEA